MPKSIEEIFDEYAQSVVDDTDIDVLMNAMKESITERLEDLPLEDALGEIEESMYSDILDGYEPDNRVLIAENSDGDLSVKWYKKGSTNLIEYGVQVEEFVDDAEASKQFGLCVYHSVACTGKL